MMQEYPKILTHPHARPAEVRPEMGKLGGGDIKAASAVLPPVTVYDAEQEAEHRSRGYVGPGVPPALIVGAGSMSGLPAGYVAQEYPKWVGDRIVHSDAEERAAFRELQVIEGARELDPGPIDPPPGEKNYPSLKEIVTEYRANGYGWKDIAADLTQSGMPHPVTGKHWTAQTVGYWASRNGIR
jgi:hypothetical protein